ncbi:LysR family transcriptional regulator [Labrys miyagiensis]|uniref:LysR family transcriptional regulator n=1 Tax=Labrys miyagiensis TaxID=346912 RepID=A0ABQ6CQ95_9HYPH|nr:LysR family transcriptional regulator [Labrys miyagiensis]GLS20391.1 LysR family transcriptional regulator [Labrys miyagiensis]
MSFDTRLVNGVGVLASVVETGNFVRAAEALGLTQPAVSRAIARLETRLGVRLLDRTTRSVSLTDEGRQFYERVMPLLADMEEAASLVAGASHAVRGRLRVNIDPYFSRLLLAQHYHAFLGTYPEMELDVVTRGQADDLVADGIDVAVRFGELSVSSVVARKLLETRIVTVASPAYLAKAGRPKHPRETEEHECILYRDPVTGRPFEWEFHRGKEVLPVNAKGRLLLSDAGTLLTACVSGAGIAQILGLGTQSFIDDGRLVDLFPDWPDEVYPLYALYPSRHHPPAKVRAFLDFVLAALGHGPA